MYERLDYVVDKGGGVKIDIKVELNQYGKILCDPEWNVVEGGTIYHRIYCIYGGHAIFESGKEKYILEKGHLYIFPINKSYCITHDPKDPLECLWCHAIVSPTILNDTIKLNVKQFDVIDNIVKAMDCFIEEGTGEKTFLELLLESMLLYISKNKAVLFMNDQRLERVLDYIELYYMDNLTNERLASLINLDRYYFIRLFKKVIGITPQKYLSNCRLSHAVNMLISGIPVEEIADKVGFQDAKAFSRFFKNNKGISPSDYRKSHYGQP